MANQNNINGVITTTNTHLIASGYTIPSGMNDNREPGEISRLFEANHSVIYEKFSNKTAHTGLLKFGPRQPFITFTPDTGDKGINGLKKYEGRGVPFASAIQDVERVTKWQLTGDGVIFLGKQFLLQGQNAFNETKLYNPLSPIMAVASKASFGVLPTPTRHLDLSSISSLLGFGGSTSAPSGTVGVGAVSNRAKLVNNPYKGLLRGATANEAFQSMSSRWESKKPGGSIIANYFKNGINKIFGSFLPVGQPPNTTYRADENSYGLMLAAKNKFDYNDEKNVWGRNYYQRWEAGSNTQSPKLSIKKKKEKSIDDSKKLLVVNGRSIPATQQYFGQSIGYSLTDNNEGYKKYGDNVGIVPLRLNNKTSNSYEYSDLLSIYTAFTKIEGTVEKNKKVVADSKYNDKNSEDVKYIQKKLQDTIDNIKSAGYEYSPLDDADKMMQQFSNTSYIGMDNITYKTKSPFSTVSPNNYNGGYMTNFRFGRSKQLLDHDKGKGFATTNAADNINMLSIINASEGNTDAEGNKYTPYVDDQIAFYFKDVVNDKVLPFRATVKGIVESLTAEWNNVNYLGTADKLYSYQGFTRTISFNFSIHITSIKELLPTWQRINYFCGLVKPSNYTGNGGRNLFSRFIIPPMIEFTIGDMYKKQPGVITSIGLSVPEGATWETLAESGENNFTNGNLDWNYLNGSIIWKKSDGKYAQFPMSADINVSINLIEKERPVSGGSHFGNAYRDSEFKNIKFDNKFSKELITNHVNKQQ